MGGKGHTGWLTVTVKFLPAWRSWSRDGAPMKMLWASAEDIRRVRVAMRERKFMVRGGGWCHVRRSSYSGVRSGYQEK